MYLWILKVSRLGKFCSQSTRPDQVLEKLENFVELKKITVEKKIEKSLKSKTKFKSKNLKKKFFKKNKSKRPR